jgi:hypothetical protein
LTDSDGNAEGYFVYKIGATTYADTKQITGEYNYGFSTIHDRCQKSHCLFDDPTK